MGGLKNGRLCNYWKIKIENRQEQGRGIFVDLCRSDTRNRRNGKDLGYLIKGKKEGFGYSIREKGRIWGTELGKREEFEVLKQGKGEEFAVLNQGKNGRIGVLNQ